MTTPATAKPCKSFHTNGVWQKGCLFNPNVAWHSIRYTTDRDFTKKLATMTTASAGNQLCTAITGPWPSLPAPLDKIADATTLGCALAGPAFMSRNRAKLLAAAQANRCFRFRFKISVTALVTITSPGSWKLDDIGSSAGNQDYYCYST